MAFSKAEKNIRRLCFAFHYGISHALRDLSDEEMETLFAGRAFNARNLTGNIADMKTADE